MIKNKVLAQYMVFKHLYLFIENKDPKSKQKKKIDG